MWEWMFGQDHSVSKKSKPLANLVLKVDIGLEIQALIERSVRAIAALQVGEWTITPARKNEQPEM